MGVPDSEICGAVVSIRFSEDIVSVWNKTANDREIADRVRDAIKRILHLPNSVHMEYKPHQASLMDKSSFRNPPVGRPTRWAGRVPTAGGGGARGGPLGGDRLGGGRSGMTGAMVGGAGDHGDHFNHRERGDQGPPRRSGSWGDRDDLRGAKPKGRTEVDRAWR